MSDAALTIDPVEPVVPPADQGGEPSPEPAKKGRGKAAEPAPLSEPGPTLAAGGKTPLAPVTADWPDDWRVRFAGEDKKDLKTLERLTDPGAMWKAYKELRTERDSGKFVRVPDAKASDEDKAAFNKALGVPETPEGYLDKIKLANGRVLGDDDKPIFESVSKALHQAGATPVVVNAVTDWWLDYQQAVQEQQAQTDADYMADSAVSLKQELGGNFVRTINAIATLFNGVEPKLMDRILEGRTSEGHKFGDDPEIVKLLAGWALELNPAASTIPPDADAVRAIEDEIAELRKLSKNDKSDYWEGPNAKKHQARYKELLDIKEKLAARQAA